MKQKQLLKIFFFVNYGIQDTNLIRQFPRALRKRTRNGRVLSGNEFKLFVTSYLARWQLIRTKIIIVNQFKLALCTYGAIRTDDELKWLTIKKWIEQKRKWISGILMAWVIDKDLCDCSIPAWGKVNLEYFPLAYSLLKQRYKTDLFHKIFVL